MTSDNNKNKQAELAGLYEEYYDKITRYAYTRVGNRNDAEDIAGEVFLKALESLRTYKEQGIPMQSWLFKIAHNLVVDHLRKASKHRYVQIDEIDIADESDPAATTELNMEIDRVKQAMGNLTEDQKEVIRLRFIAGLSSREVSGVMHKSDGAVREMQSAALARLRQILGN